jgi:hypothetical protein
MIQKAHETPSSGGEAFGGVTGAPPPWAELRLLGRDHPGEMVGVETYLGVHRVASGGRFL